MYDPSKDPSFPDPPAYSAEPYFPPPAYTDYGLPPFARAPSSLEKGYSRAPDSDPPVEPESQEPLPPSAPPNAPQDVSIDTTSKLEPGLEENEGQATGAEGGEADDLYGFGGAFVDKTVRRIFVRKVFAILSLQLAVVAAFIGVCLFVHDVEVWLRGIIWPYYLSFAVFFGIYIALICLEGTRRKHSTIVFGIFTVALAFAAGMISWYQETEILLIGVGQTAFVMMIIARNTFNAKIDVTGCCMCLGLPLMVLCASGAAFALVFYVDGSRLRMPVLMNGAVVAFVYSAYLTIDIQLIMRGKVDVNPDECVYSALQLYLDVAYLFFAFLVLLWGFMTACVS